MWSMLPNTVNAGEAVEILSDVPFPAATAEASDREGS